MQIERVNCAVCHGAPAVMRANISPHVNEYEPDWVCSKCNLSLNIRRDAEILKMLEPEQVLENECDCVACELNSAHNKKYNYSYGYCVLF